ncbi:response regulator transcription factor [Marinobacter salexigens]|uniref:DNA-binding response regulator n=1 Tax=Marinobacter salexigens TaxID=1925763 RepID=A0ABS6A931_9GAMM|nr:DNA-binding response regulator [Marinobacter salexigens]MBU2874656.1 DNA-binding response regulator [Marinobacter salexigens]
MDNTRAAFGEHVPSIDKMSRPHILVVDDSPDDVRSVVSAMNDQGWRISLAHDARQGFQRALLLQPDLILLDVQMPHMDGFTFCRLLRESDAARVTPVIFLTSAGSLDHRLEGLQMGGVDYILKPYEPLEVLARMRIHLQLQHRDTSELGEPVLATTSEDELLLRAVVRYISQNLRELPSLQEIARSVGTHDKRLSKLFREHMGVTVFAYIREVRLRKGQELLSDSNLSVQDISEWLGFGSACNFTTAFRNGVGMTPTQFRQQAKGS